MDTSSRLDGINEYYFSAKLREIEKINREGIAVINLGIGSPDLPPHPDVINVLREESLKNNVHSYQSYKGSIILRNAISKFYQEQYNVSLDPDKEILPLLGSKEGIMHVCMTYLNPNDEVLIPNPGYPTYKSAVELAGGKAISYDLNAENNWLPDLAALEQSGLKKVKMMWINYPHMPTGKNADPGFFKEVIAFAIKHQILICHDNPYSFILNDNPVSLLSIDGSKDVAIELNSLSKSHNMAGWRVGMICGSEEKINQVLRFKSNMDSGMFLPVQLAAAKALSLPGSWFDELNAVYLLRRKSVYDLLDALECTYSKDQAGLFVWAKTPAGQNDSYAFSDKILNSAKVFITPGSIFGSEGDKYIRVSLCKPVADVEEAIRRINESKA